MQLRYRMCFDRARIAQMHTVSRRFLLDCLNSAQPSFQRPLLGPWRLALLCSALMVQRPTDLGGLTAVPKQRTFIAHLACANASTQLSMNLRPRQAEATYIFCMLSSSYPLDFGNCCGSILSADLHLGRYFVLTGSVFSLFKSIYASDKHCCWSILCNKLFAG
jgi:hypothetical protein